MSEIKTRLDSIDRRIIRCTQNGLPVVKRPYHAIAERLQLDPALVMERLQAMRERGVIRRIGAVPNHYRLGYRANGMSVWDVPDDKVEAYGRVIGALDFVSHCYQRPRRPPDWPYNLYAMVHGRDRGAADDQVRRIASILGEYDRGHAVLYSTRILKKTGLRLN
jgi:DNA-binding Lrp family transcriptional regulator